jgi:RHS repeat-associated protein
MRDYFVLDIIELRNYYPFGMQMPGRKSGNQDYRFSFQGQEKDDEIKGQGNSLNYEYRMHDPRIGRFFAVDPLAAKYPYNSTYAFSENRVIDGIELEGLEFYKPDEAVLDFFYNRLRWDSDNVSFATRRAIYIGEIKRDVITIKANFLNKELEEINRSLGIHTPATDKVELNSMNDAEKEYLSKSSTFKSSARINLNEKVKVHLNGSVKTVRSMRTGSMKTMNRVELYTFFFTAAAWQFDSYLRDLDLSTANSQIENFSKSIDMVTDAYSNLIPEEFFGNQRVFSDLVNYVFRGDVTSVDGYSNFSFQDGFYEDSFYDFYYTDSKGCIQWLKPSDYENMIKSIGTKIFNNETNERYDIQESTYGDE